MDYRIDLTVPADTTELEPVSAERHVLPGTWKQYAPVLPTGCNDMVRWRLLIDENQIVPVEPGTWMLGNGVMGVFEQSIVIPPGGVNLKLVACSPGTTYEHNIYVTCVVVQPEATLEDVVKALSVSFPESSLP
jgi:hypothetical protein